MQTIARTALPPAYQELLAAAIAVRERAYCPYSGFHVGAALLPLPGEPVASPIGGANVENAAYPSGLCAERAALVAANAQGVRRFRAVAINARASARSPAGHWDLGQAVATTRPTAPCGACRQMLLEAAHLGTGDLDILLTATAADTVLCTTLTELLPLGFGPRDLAS